MLEKNFQSYDFWPKLEKEIRNAGFQVNGQQMTITGLGERAGVLQDRYKNYIARALVISKDIRSIVFME